MTYLITGATGDVGSKVVRRLIELGERPRVFVRDTKKARARFGDRVEIVMGDLGDEVAMRKATEGVEKVFLVNSGPEIPVRDGIAAAAAKDAGVEHLVKLSSMDVQYGLALGVWHEEGEAAIRASGMVFTFVRPTGFMSNLLAWAGSIKTDGVIRSSTGYGRRAFIHSEDIAAVVTKVLTQRGYEGESLALTGPEALNFAEVAEKIGAAIGRELAYEVISDEEAGERYSKFSGSQEETEAHVSLWQAIREGRLANVTNTVERVLGRKPIALDQWITENAGEFC